MSLLLDSEMVAEGRVLVLLVSVRGAPPNFDLYVAFLVLMVSFRLVNCEAGEDH